MTNQNRDVLITTCILLSSTITHLAALGTFPIFADEAIYIRWAQLIIDDWQQYLFFSLNDGKPPLFIWLLAPFQFLVNDQLVAARLISVLVGIGQALASRWIVKLLGGNKVAQYIAMIMSLWLPFWYFYQHLALMDGLLTLFLTVALGCVIRLVQSPKAKQLPFFSIVATAISIGLSLWTKLPALFFFPGFLIIPWMKTQKWSDKQRQLIPIALSLAGGLAFFGLLRISPAFGQLFHRGQDFAVTHFSFTDSVPRWIYLVSMFAHSMYIYITLPVILLALTGLFYDRTRRKVGILLLSSFLFTLPFILIGQVVHSRYFLPSLVGITAAAALGFEVAYDQWIQSAKNLHFRIFAAIVLVSFLSLSLNSIVPFVYAIGWMPDATPFINEDKEQYLTEWSSGHGIRQTVAFLQAQNAAGKSVAVATEGRFGTLPDGLLVFFHRRNVDQLYIEGIGQYPVKSIPHDFAIRAKNFDQTVLVVNSHRMQLSLPESQKIAEFCRPFSAPCLQLWDITSLVQAEAATNTQIP